MGKTVTAAISDDYLELVKEFPLKAIQTRSEFERAMRVLGPLAGRIAPRSSGEEDYYEALIVLVRDYETHHPVKLPKVSPLELLQHLMTESGMTQTKLAKLLGIGKSSASMILSGQRSLTKSHIAALAAHFKLAPSAFF